MSKHTPGPWLIDSGTTVYSLNAHGYNRFSAHVQRGHTDGKFPTEPEELEANARLIAAAPELLEAAKNAERLLGIAGEQARLMHQRRKLGWAEAGDDGQFGIAVKTDACALRWQALEKERNALIDANRAAIAKATGDQQ